MEIEYGQSEAFKIIRTAASDVPTSAEREATAYLLRAATSNRVPRTDVATTLSKAACRWNNFKLWRRVLEATSAMEQVGVLGLDELLEAFVCFGIPKVQPVYVMIDSRHQSALLTSNATQGREYPSSRA